MLLNSPRSRRLAALSAACLLSVAAPALAQEKTKTKTKTKPVAEATATDVDFSISIPTIEAVDSNVDEAVLNDILRGGLAENAEALASLTATSISVPQIEVSVTGQDDGDTYSASVVFSDLLLENVTDGVAAEVSLSGIDMTSDEGQFTFGTLSAANLDIGGLLGFYGLVEATGSGEMTTVYTDFSAEGGTLVADEVECSLGPVSGAEFRARPLQTSFVDFIRIAEELEEDGEDLDPAMLSQLMHMYADLITAFETSEITFGGVSCDGLDDDGEAVSFSIAGMTLGAMSPGIYPSITMDGLDITVDDDGSMSLGNLTIKPSDLTNLVETLRSVPENVDDAWFEANVRNLFPEMEGLAFSGFSIDIPDPELETGRIQAEIGAFDLTLGDYLHGMPTSAEMSADNIRTELPLESGDESIDQLRALGVETIDAGFRIALAWDEAASNIAVEEVSMTGLELATVTLSGTIANATADLFDIDMDRALVAAMGLAVKSLDLKVVDDGLGDIVVAAIAADQGANAETLRPIYADLAKGTVISLLAGMAEAADLGDAVGAFISGKARTLEIGISAKTDPGLGMADFMAAETNPMSLLDKVDVTASAE